MRHVRLLPVVAAVLMLSAAASGSDPPPVPFGQSNAFHLKTAPLCYVRPLPLQTFRTPDEGILTRGFVMGDPLPNPFRSTVTIPFSLAPGGTVSVAVYDLRGRLVRQLASETMTDGHHSRQWDGRDNAGKAVPTGVYFARITVGELKETARLLLVK